MVKTRLLISFIFSLLFIQGIFAQEKEITGTITDSQGSPMLGVSVIVKGSNKGATSDFDGLYVLSDVSAENILVFSYLGFKNQEIQVANNTSINVVMEEETTDLEQVVVVGYGSLRKKDLTGAIVSINAESIEEQPLGNVDQAIQGQVSGLTVTRSSGQPGGAVSVRVRGVTSVTGSNEPLYVIDGVTVTSAGNDTFDFSIFSGEGGQTRVSPLSNLNPSDIESIQVLKDASSAAIYGAQASNGVILITTKRGKSGKAKFTYETYGGFQTAPKFYDLMNLQEYARYSNETRTNVLGLDPIPELANPSLLGSGTDWQREVFRAAAITNHQLSVSGGKDGTKFYTSVSYFNQEGIVINTDFRRYGMRMNLDHKYNDWIKFGNNVNFSNSIENVGLNDASTGIINTSLRQSPNIPVRLSDGSFGGPDQGSGLGSNNSINPVAWSEIRNNQLERYKINGNFFTEFKLFPGLTFKSDIGYDYNTTKNDAFNPTYEIGASINTINRGVKSFGESFFWLYKNYLTYSKLFGNHTLNILAGTEAQKLTFQGINGERSNFPSNDITGFGTGDLDTSIVNSYKGSSSILSYFGRINYGFDGRYLVSASVRYDGSSKFAPGNRWGLFPSASLGWVVSQEPFMESISDTWSWFKIRAGYGTSGNQDIGDNLWRSFLLNATSVYGSSYGLANFADENVTWESLVSPNIGLELGFLDDAIRLDVDVYEKTSKDFLAVRPLPSIFGVSNSQQFLGVNPPTVNFGEMVNRGIDVNLRTRNIEKEKFEWSTNIIFSAYTNEVTELVNEDDAILGFFEFGQELTRSVPGEPLGQFYGYQTDGLITSLEELQDPTNPTPIPIESSVNENSGTWLGDVKFKDLNGDGVIDADDKTFIGSPHPDFTYSITNDFKFGAFDLSIFLQGSQGNEIYNWTRRFTEGQMESSANQAAIIADRYRPGNTDTNVPRFSPNDGNGNVRVSDRFIEDGSYLRIQSITFGCNIPTKTFGDKTFFNQMRLYGTVQNLYTFTNYSGYDPEVGSFNQNAILTGVDNGRYPVPRTVTFGLNVQF